MIKFNKPFISGKEIEYIREAVSTQRIGGGGNFTIKCEQQLKKYFDDKPDVILTNSCTSALETIALLLDIEAGDEIILPSFTHVSTANAFALRGATLKFCDIDPQTLNITPEQIAKKITENTKAIVVVHYAGVACKMDEIMKLADDHGIFVIEDAALGFDAFYKMNALGSMGHLGALSFHETKNISSGEGGALVINDKKFKERAYEIVLKGTNRKDFDMGNASFYTWTSLGSSYSPSELQAAYLYAQLENYKVIQQKRVAIWKRYKSELTELELQGAFQLPYIPGNVTTNASVFYLLMPDEKSRKSLQEHLSGKSIQAVIHYVPLHSSPFIQENHSLEEHLPVTETYSKSILRLPIYPSLSRADQDFIIKSIYSYFENKEK